MSGLTPRFKFSFFGGSTPGSVNDDGQKFTGLDRLTFDRLLASIEVHDHKFRPNTGTASAAATLALLTEGGSLQAGYTYYYRYAVVDAFGNESIASAESFVSTPSLLPMPGSPDVSVADGTAGALPPGLYYYALTAIRGTEETPLGGATLAALQAGQTAALIALPAFGAAESLRLWRMGSTEAGYTKVALINVGTTQYIDAGAVPADPCSTDPGNAPPQSNTGASSYGVQVTLPVDVDLATARSWRLYRTVYPGIYPTASLVHNVVERTTEWDATSPLVRTWQDTGAPSVSGRPMDSDLNMRFQSFTFDSATALPAAAGYPENYPLVVDGKLYAMLGGAWTAIGGGGGGTPTLVSPSGNRFILSVADDGSLVTTPTLFPGPPAAPTNLVVI